MTITFGFKLIKEQFIAELRTQARLFRHVKTSAELLSLENDEENKVFTIVFRTPPPDSTGLPHIMEHSVLCGSEKYPVKEPFVELVKGSLNTFANAFTYPDKTCYPVASQNLQDFYNLVDVYMDAVLHPLMPPRILQQEGWHYELESVDEPLSYKGVVFNEMKGAYSNPDDVLQDRARQSLYPDTPYRFDAGGDPRSIPNLTYEQFKAFHDKYYHPSNARVCFYGNDDPQERLRRMDSYFQGYAVNEQSVDSRLPLQPPFKQPRRLVIPYDPGEEAASNKGFLVMNWLLPESTDPQAALALGILAHILIGTPASPLRKALIDSGLGEDLAGTGLESHTRQMHFSTGLRGIAVNQDYSLTHEEQVQTLILQTLENLAHQGIDPETVAASVNTVEFALRENNSGGFPRGLLVILNTLTTWLYDGDPLTPLAFEAPLAAIKDQLARGEAFFEALIQKHFLDNPHRTTVIMQPEPGLNQREEAAEKERLAQAHAAMSQDDLLAAIEDTRRLKKLQETPDTPEALATIPSLELADLDKENKLIPLAISEHNYCKFLYHDLFTNGILYLDVGFNLRTLPQEFLPYISLFGRALVEIGTDKEDFVRLSQHIGRATGGIHPASFASMIRGTQSSATWLFLRGKAITSQVDEMLSILRDILLTVRLDNPERFRQMVLEDKAGLEAGLVPAGHRVVNTRLSALFNQADWFEEQTGGVEYLFFLRRLAETIENDWPAVLEKLESIRRILLNRQNMLCNITVDQPNWEQIQPRLIDFVSALPASPVTLAEWRPEPAPHFEGLVVPAQVNYVGKGVDLFHFGYQADGSVHVILNYLQATWLWERVRVLGGAYGAFAPFDPRSGLLTFLSYRDPNLLGTLNNYDQSAQFLRQLDLSQAELTKSIIGAIGNMDAYQLPDAKGYTSMLRYLAGDTNETRQLWRDQILSTTPEDFRAFGAILENVKDAGWVVVLGSQDAVDAANQERGEWLQVKKIL